MTRRYLHLRFRRRSFALALLLVSLIAVLWVRSANTQDYLFIRFSKGSAWVTISRGELAVAVTSQDGTLRPPVVSWDHKHVPSTAFSHGYQPYAANVSKVFEWAGVSLFRTVNPRSIGRELIVPIWSLALLSLAVFSIVIVLRRARGAVGFPINGADTGDTTL